MKKFSNAESENGSESDTDYVQTCGRLMVVLMPVVAVAVAAAVVTILLVPQPLHMSYHYLCTVGWVDF
jgi:hypothetical protein